MCMYMCVYTYYTSIVKKKTTTPFVGWNKGNLISDRDLKKKKQNKSPPADQCSASVLKTVVCY